MMSVTRRPETSASGKPQKMWPGSILSAVPDGHRFYYGFAPGDGRQINVRSESDGILRWMRWFAYVGGKKLPQGHGTFEEAETAALAWMAKHPDRSEP